MGGLKFELAHTLPGLHCNKLLKQVVEFDLWGRFRDVSN